MSEQIREAAIHKTILRKKTVLSRCGISNSFLYEAIRDGRFPAPIKLCESGRMVGWLEEDVEKWIDERIAASRQPVAGAA